MVNENHDDDERIDYAIARYGHLIALGFEDDYHMFHRLLGEGFKPHEANNVIFAAKILAMDLV